MYPKNKVAIHVAPHAHPVQSLFPGRFGGENHVLNAILSSAKKHSDLACYLLVLGTDNLKVEFGQNSHLIEVKKESQEFGDGCFLRDTARLANELVRMVEDLLSKTNEVSVTFHYWDGAYAFMAIASELCDTVKTVFVSHSLQATHVKLGIDTVSAPPKIALEAERFAFENADMCWLMSSYEREIAEEAYVRTARPVLTVAGHIDLPVREKLLLGTTLNDVCILCHGRDTERKNLLGFVRAVSELETNRINVLVRVGLEKERLKPAKSVSWEPLPFLSRGDYLEKVETAQVVVMPSLYEPFGLVALEAFLAGKILIAPTNSAVREFRKDDGVILANTGENASLSRALCCAIERARYISFRTEQNPKRATDLVAELLTVYPEDRAV